MAFSVQTERQGGTCVVVDHCLSLLPPAGENGEKGCFFPFRSRWNLNKFHGRNTFSYVLLNTCTVTFKSHVKPQIIIICD